MDGGRCVQLSRLEERASRFDTYWKENTMETVTSGDGTNIAFDRSGEGPPVILVGGAFNSRSFDHWLRYWRAISQ